MTEPDDTIVEGELVDEELEKDLAELVTRAKAKAGSNTQLQLLRRGEQRRKSTALVPIQLRPAMLAPTNTPTMAEAHFSMRVHEELFHLIQTARTKPRTYRTPEFQQEARDTLEVLVEELDKAS